MKSYQVDIYIQSDATYHVRAKSKAEARKKAIARLNKKKPASLISREYPSNRLDINVEEQI